MTKLSDSVEKAKIWWKSKTVIGIILFITPSIVKIINPELTVDVEAGVDEVFNQATQIAEQTDALWVTITESFGAILTALGLRNAKGTIKAY